MPGYDGTGPRGRGPMTGGGRGFCIVRLPAGPTAQEAEGFAGFSGLPGGGGLSDTARGMTSVSLVLHRIEQAMRTMERRLVSLETSKS